jgi:hypothetical protein
MHPIPVRDAISVKGLERIPRRKMNLDFARKVLSVTEAQPGGSIKLRGKRISYELDQMASAGLIELGTPPENNPDVAVIQAVTNAGRRLLRVLEHKKTATYVKRAFGNATFAQPDLEVVVVK